MTTHRRRTLFGLLAAVGLGAALLPGTGSAATVSDAQQQWQLAQARLATSSYNWEPNARAAGYLRTDECVSSPEGGMGLHYVKPALVDRSLNIRTPEAVLYDPGSGDSRQLVAVEYVFIDRDQDVNTDDDRPSLFGVPFDGPMLGHGPGQPIHYDLHAWVWKENPHGVFAPWNPTVVC